MFNVNFKLKRIWSPRCQLCRDVGAWAHWYCSTLATDGADQTALRSTVELVHEYEPQFERAGQA